MATLSLTALLLRGVDGHPEVDTGGVVWEQAVRFQTWSLLLGQTLLIGILMLKSSTAGAALALCAVVFTLVRTHALRVRYSGLASGISLQRAVALDARAPPQYEDLQPYRPEAEL